MSLILLVRHGENNWVKEHRLAGWTPGVELNENGHEQAAQLGQRLADLPIKAIYSSPLVRCWQTAEHLSKHHDLDIVELRTMGEVKYGEWEGEKISKLSKLPEWHTIQFAPSRFEFPEGESLRGVQARAIDALEGLTTQHPEEMIVVVSHADVIKLVLAHYLGAHMDLFQRIGLSPASVSAIWLNNKGMVRVLRVNDDGPIKAPPPPKKKVEAAGDDDSAEKQTASTEDTVQEDK